MHVKVLSLMAALLLVVGCTDDTITDDTTMTDGTVVPDAPAPTGPAMDANDALVVNIGDRIFFDFDRSDLRPDAIDQLNRQADWLQQNGSITVAIEGHADERGTREYNLALSERRANSAKQYVQSMGVSGGRMETIPYGKERPAVLGSNEEAWAQNRRAVMVVRSGSLS